MTLGEKITSLRKTHKLSQGDLAEKLNVSRQSVSKWETDASVPELDKLIMISNLFNVSLDELVKSDIDSSEKQTEKRARTYLFSQDDTLKILGILLLFVGILGIVLSYLTPFALLLISGICFFLNGLVLLIFRKHTKLICSWLTLLLLASYISFVVGDPLVLLKFVRIYPAFNVVSILSYVFWIVVVLMTVFTVKTLRKTK